MQSETDKVPSSSPTPSPTGETSSSSSSAITGDESGKNKRKGGRPRVLDKAAVAAEVWRQMDQNGEFSPDDPNWNAKTCLYDALRDKFGEHPDSTLEPYVKAPLAEWRAKRAEEEAQRARSPKTTPRKPKT